MKSSIRLLFTTVVYTSWLKCSRGFTLLNPSSSIIQPTVLTLPQPFRPRHFKKETKPHTSSPKFPTRSILSAAQQSDDSNNENENQPTTDSNNNSSTEENDDDEYDFESGFQARLKQEGGATNIRLKADLTSAKRSVDSASRAAKKSVASVSSATRGATEDVGLLSGSEWGQTLGALALVVVLAVGFRLVGPKEDDFGSLGTREQLERLNGAEERKVQNVEKVVFGMPMS